MANAASSCKRAKTNHGFGCFCVCSGTADHAFVVMTSNVVGAVPNGRLANPNPSVDNYYEDCNRKPFQNLVDCLGMTYDIQGVYIYIYIYIYICGHPPCRAYVSLLRVSRCCKCLKTL